MITEIRGLGTSLDKEDRGALWERNQVEVVSSLGQSRSLNPASRVQVYGFVSLISYSN